MAEVRRGRWTAEVDGDLVVFMIGMRVNRWRALRRWLPVFRAMPAMLRELEADEEGGLLGYRMFPGLRSFMVVQYWRSTEHLLRYANDSDRAHRPAWLAFFKDSWRDGAVGIWHETYAVDSSECIYGNMPPVGLGQVGDLVPVGRHDDTATRRLGRQDVGSAA
ncbi:MAG: DUF4188 domain-containing protein [Streptosporangiaceae bacterium]